MKIQKDRLGTNRINKYARHLNENIFNSNSRNIWTRTGHNTNVTTRIKYGDSNEEITTKGTTWVQTRMSITKSELKTDDHLVNKWCASIKSRKNRQYCMQYMWDLFMADTSGVSLYASSYNYERNKNSWDVMMEPSNSEAVSKTSKKVNKEDTFWDLLLYKYSKLDSQLRYSMGWKSKINSENSQVGRYKVQWDIFMRCISNLHC